MTDGYQRPAETDIQDERLSESQLQFPKLLIEASFQSLLSYSQSLSVRTVVPMPRSDYSLSESWSSLSERDLSHDDDDLHSEATDTGSLIDISTPDDIHSVDDRGDSSDAEEEEHVQVQGSRQDTQHDDDSVVDEDVHHRTRSFQSQLHAAQSQDGLKLTESTVLLSNSETTSTQTSKSFIVAEMEIFSHTPNADEAAKEVTGSLVMPLSPDSLELAHRPYNILYYASDLSSAEIKSEVLGKIGAALISSSDSHRLDHDSESPCYHVVPSEFGPGSRPSIADLIPIPTQIHVSECTIPSSTTNTHQDSDLAVQLSTGETLVSRRARRCEVGGQQQWQRSDLAVLVVSRQESADGRSKVAKMAEFTKRHDIPTICLRQEPGWDDDTCLAEIDSRMLHKSVRSVYESEKDQTEHKMLVDVDLFLALDTEQLNRHINYLTTPATAEQQTLTSVYQRLSHMINGLDAVLSLLPFSLDKWVGADRKLKDTQPKWIVDASPPPKTTRPKQGQNGDRSLPFWKAEGAMLVTGIYRTAMFIGIVALSLIVFQTGQAAMSSWLSTKTSTSADSLLGPAISLQPPPIVATVDIAPPPATSRAQTYALSGPLQAFEKQVQAWIPVNIAGPKQVQSHTVREVPVRNPFKARADVCQDVVPAHIRPSIKVDPKFFIGGLPAFDVYVLRGNEDVHSEVKHVADGLVAVMVKRKDMHGQLTVHLGGQDETVCASVDLKNSVPEAFTLWMRNQKANMKAATMFSNRQARLLEVRASRSGLVNTALELHYTTTQGFGAVVEAMEKSAVKQARSCSGKNKKQCIAEKLGLEETDMLKPVQEARQLSVELIVSTRKQIAEHTRQARKKANDVTAQAKGEVSKAVQLVQSSLGELAVVGRAWPGVVTGTLAEAQQRARKLVKKSRSEMDIEHRCEEF